MTSTPTSPATLRVALAQSTAISGAVDRNAATVRSAVDGAVAAGADVLLTPEMVLSGYPAEDLLGERAFVADCEAALADLAAATPASLVAVVGTPMATIEHTGIDALPRAVANTVALLHNRAIVGHVAKHLLPEYSVFDDARWVTPGTAVARTADINGVLVGFAICEDIWTDAVAMHAAQQGAQVILVANASPYTVGKPAVREAMVARLARITGATIVYTNAVGGQDELVFDGGSLVVGPDGTTLLRAPLFEDGLFVLDVPIPARRERGFPFATVHTTGATPASLPAPVLAAPLSPEAEMYAALVRGLGDYVRHNGFTQVILGLSGGLDSALAAALAVDALGPHAVRGIGMPGPYSSEHSVTDAKALAENLGIRFDILSIKETYEAEVTLLGDLLDGPGVAVAKENIQARLRALHLMTIANATNALVVNTGNRSEAAVGYFTLGGDSSGGYAPLKDVPKTVAYALSQWRNKVAEDAGLTPPIPQSTIVKPPSAELAPDQVDTNSLPPYPVLDHILALYLEQMASADEIVASLVAEQGVDAAYARETVLRVLHMTDRAEHKRRQVAPGLKVTARAFGKDRRVPITNGRRHHVTDTGASAA